MAILTVYDIYRKKKEEAPAPQAKVVKEKPVTGVSLPTKRMAQLKTGEFTRLGRIYLPTSDDTLGEEYQTIAVKLPEGSFAYITRVISYEKSSVRVTLDYHGKLKNPEDYRFGGEIDPLTDEEEKYLTTLNLM